MRADNGLTALTSYMIIKTVAGEAGGGLGGLGRGVGDWLATGTECGGVCRCISYLFKQER